MALFLGVVLFAFGVSRLITAAPNPDAANNMIVTGGTIVIGIALAVASYFIKEKEGGGT